jgi:aerobic-type carbon monoxide dehydrogenase small subunit (CoxS/CutS family)
LPYSAATVQADGGEVQTVEVLRTIDALRPLQQAFRKLQCGY